MELTGLDEQDDGCGQLSFLETFIERKLLVLY